MHYIFSNVMYLVRVSSSGIDTFVNNLNERSSGKKHLMDKVAQAPPHARSLVSAAALIFVCNWRRREGLGRSGLVREPASNSHYHPRAIVIVITSRSLFHLKRLYVICYNDLLVHCFLLIAGKTIDARKLLNCGASFITLKDWKRTGNESMDTWLWVDK